MRKDHAISRAIPARCLPNSFWRVKKVSETQRVTEQVADNLKPLRGQEQEKERAGLAAPCCIPKHKPHLSAALGPSILLWACLQVCLLCAHRCIAGKHCSARASYKPYSPCSSEPPAGGSLLPLPPALLGSKHLNLQRGKSLLWFCLLFKGKGVLSKFHTKFQFLLWKKGKSVIHLISLSED